MKAIDFSLPDQDGATHNLSDYKGKWLLVYFYPKDDTPGCTVEACSFRDRWETLGIEVVGISKDSVVSHKKFADKHKLNFVILSDEKAEIIKKYGAWGVKKFMGKTYEGILRNSYLINPEGEIVKTYEKVNPLKHVDEIKRDLESLK